MARLIRTIRTKRVIALASLSTAALVAALTATGGAAQADSPSPSPSSSLTPTPTTAAPVAPPVATDGTVNAAAYRKLAARLATPAGIAFRFGSPSSAYGAAPADRPTAPQPASRIVDNHGKRANSLYQVGGPQNPAEHDYSSDQGQVGYLSAGPKKTIGIDHIETLAMDEGTFSEKPQLSWTYYGGGHPEPDFVGQSDPARCIAKLGVPSGNFVAQARAYAHGEQTANTIAVFDNGVVAAAGTNTARGHICLKLPSDLHPTAISVTNGNEFALITAMNTTTLKSDLAVVALGGTQRSGTFWNYEWPELYPGFENYGMPTFAKLLGTVELPMAGAVGVSAVSDYSGGQPITSGNGGIAQPGQFPLSNEANRQSFISGPNKDKRATAGYAVVFSRAERKTVFVDLQPLFDRITGTYFGSRSAFTAATGNIGQGASQFPQAFSVNAAEKPVVVKSVTTQQPPTAVAGLLSGAATPRAYVATRDGELHVFDVRGLATAAPATAAGITEQPKTIAIGRNVTSLTYVKDRVTGHALDQSLDTTLIATSRGDREIQWITLTGDGGGVSRTLRDSRLVDPIAAEDNNTHGTESYVLSIADYGAGRLFNYRYGPVVFHTNGNAAYGIQGRSAAASANAFEFGGAYDPHGRPFSISITNVT